MRYDHMHALVARKQAEVSQAGETMIAKAKASLLGGQRDAFEQKFVDHTNNVLSAWTSLSQEMFQDYSDNTDIRGEVNVHMPNGVEASQSAASLGYPAWWLRAVGYSNGP